MKQGFVTVYGKLIIENNTLFIRNVVVPFSRSIYARVLKEIFIVAAFIMQFYREDEIRSLIGLILWGFILLYHIPEIWDLVAKRDYANRIPLQHIVHYSTKDHLSGLEVDVILQLKNGRYRKIAFRKLEHQHESFIELLSQYLSAPKFA
jgi:hypothetical protein